MKRSLSVVLAMLCLGTISAHAVTKYVDNGGSDGGTGDIGDPWEHIIYALTNVAASDTIHVNAGTYNLASGETFSTGSVVNSGLVLPDQVSLVGDGAATTIIDADGAATRVINASACTTAGLIAELTIQNGAISAAGATPGGGIYGASALVVSNCIVRNNTITGGDGSDEGGGIYEASLVTDCLIKGNRTGSRGGGLFDVSEIRNCEISDNVAGGLHGGGIYDADVVSGCVIKHNLTSSFGGGIFDATVISNSLIFANEARQGAGGGIHVASVVFNSVIAGNLVADGGGGGSGGGLSATTASEIRNCTIVNNTAVSAGGMNVGAGTIVSNCIIWNNSDDLTGHTDANVVFSIVSDDDGDGTCSHADPLLIAGYFLGTGSPAIDAGAGTVGDAGLTGRVTTTNGVADSGTVDIGYHYPAGTTAFVAERYVRPDGSDGNLGTSDTPGGAWETITYAMSQATNGWTVHVAAGTYNETSGEIFTNAIDSASGGIVIPDGVTLVGAGASSTILDAVGSGDRVLFAPVGNSVVEGLTICNGSGSTGGGGIRGYGLAVRNCIVRDNSNSGGFLDGYGGGIFGCVGISGNTIINNSCSSGGGGITFGGNITGNIILGNSGASFGAGGINAPGGTIESNVVAANVQNATTSGQGAGISAGSCSLLLKNNTIAYNQGVFRGGMTANGASTPIRNCIFWGNSGSVSNNVYGGDNASITYSNTEEPTLGDGTCIHTNPSFYAPMGFSSTLNGTVLTDSSASWTPGSLVGAYLNPDTNNTSVPIVFEITANTATGITCSAGGLTGAGSAGDGYRVEDYHLRSKGERYTYGLGFLGPDPVIEHSPSIDAGDPSDAWSLEPDPNGGQINQGAFGGTIYASLTGPPPPDGTVIIVR